MQEVIEHDQAPVKEHKNSEEAPVEKIKGIKILKTPLNFSWILLSYAVVSFTSKSGPDDGLTKDQLKINTFFTKKLFKVACRVRVAYLKE